MFKSMNWKGHDTFMEWNWLRGGGTEAVNGKQNKIEWWANGSCHWNQPPPPGNMCDQLCSRQVNVLKHSWAEWLPESFTRGFRLDKCACGLEWQDEMKAGMLLRETTCTHRRTFAVWALAAWKPPAVPYLPQPGQTAASEHSTGTCCSPVHDAVYILQGCRVIIFPTTKRCTSWAHLARR